MEEKEVGNDCVINRERKRNNEKIYKRNKGKLFVINGGIDIFNMENEHGKWKEVNKIEESPIEIEEFKK